MKRALLAALLLSLAACPGEPGETAPTNEAPAPAAKDEARVTCPPCGMQTKPPYETTEIGGMQFWACNDRCEALIREDPERFAEHAIE